MMKTERPPIGRPFLLQVQQRFIAANSMILETDTVSVLEKLQCKYGH